MSLAFAGDDVVWILWKYAVEEDVHIPYHRNEFLGVYVTAGA